MDIKSAMKTFGKKFSCGASSEKNAENMMEVTIQGDLVVELGELCNELYEIPKECMYVVDGKNRKKLFAWWCLFETCENHLFMYICILRTSSETVMDF